MRGALNVNDSIPPHGSDPVTVRSAVPLSARLADPIPLGLAGFGLTTFMLSMIEVGAVSKTPLPVAPDSRSARPSPHWSRSDQRSSMSRRFPRGLANNSDQVGRYVMVQGATQVAARFPMDLRMYKAPPPEVSTEQFYETDPRRGFARGFSIQTVAPLPIGWAEHVQAAGHWGAELREYMRDYNHWTVLGALCELLPQPENRVTLADEKDSYGIPVANFSHSMCENDTENIACATKTMQDIWEHAGAQDTLKVDRYAHLVGGARMGFTPEDSVVDANHRAWEVPNLFLVDGSVFPTEGAANPALVIMALANRCAGLLEHKRLDASRPASHRRTFAAG
jgi:choline dehydrogenase-like flavoprotein